MWFFYRMTNVAVKRVNDSLLKRNHGMMSDNQFASDAAIIAAIE